MAEMKFNAVNLSTVAGGLLEERFQEFLLKIEAIMADLDSYERAKDNRAKVKLEFTLTLGVSESDLEVVASAQMRRPKHVAVGDKIYPRDGKMLVWADPWKNEQQDLFAKADGPKTQQPVSLSERLAKGKE